MVGEMGADPTTPEGNGFTDRRVCRFSVLSCKVGIVSCIIRYYFNPCGTGSHLYPANTNTLRSRTLSSRSYTTLVGLGFSPSPCFPLCAFIIARIRLFVKHFFFAKSYIFPRRYLARISWQFFLSNGAQSQPILAELARGFL